MSIVRARLQSRSAAVVLGAVLLVAAVLGWLLYFSPVLLARDVEVRGATGGAGEKIRKVATAQLGQPLVKVDTAAVEVEISQLGGYASVTVARRWPRTIAIEVQPRQPVLTYRDPQGQLHVVDDRGRPFATVSRAPAGAPVVTLTRLGDATGTGVQSALTAAAAAVTAVTPAQRTDLREVTVTGPNLVVLGFKGTRVVWGDASNAALKARVMTSVMAQGKYRTIDVSAPENPATTG